jgi:hypothetical protein
MEGDMVLKLANQLIQTGGVSIVVEGIAVERRKWWCGEGSDGKSEG